VGVIVSTCRGAQGFRGDEAFEPAALRMQLAPIVEGEIDDNEPGGRELFPQPFSGLHVARCNQHYCEIVEARIMSDNQERMCARDSVLYGREN